MEIAKLRELTQAHSNIDYGVAASVRAGNAAAEAIANIIQSAVAEGRAAEVIALLSDSELGSWVAYTAAVLPGLTSGERKQCITRIKEIALAGGLEATAAKMWLKQQGHVS